MIRTQVHPVSGRVELFLDGRPLGMERFPRAHTVRQRIGRAFGDPTYAIHGLASQPATVSYRMLSDALRIGLPPHRVELAIGVRKSTPFSFAGRTLILRFSPLRGRLAVEANDGRTVARGRYGLAYVEFAEYEGSLEPLLAALAVGLAIRLLWVEASVVMIAAGAA